MSRRDVLVPAAAVVAALLGAPRGVVFALAAAGVALTAAAAARSLPPMVGSGLADAARPAVLAAPRPPRPLLDAQRLVTARGGSAGGVHYWLRPLLRDVVADRLLRHHGVDLDDPRAADLVPRPLWDLVRSDCPPPPDRHGPAPDLPTLHRMVDQAGGL